MHDALNLICQGSLAKEAYMLYKIKPLNEYNLSLFTKQLFMNSKGFVHNFLCSEKLFHKHSINQLLLKILLLHMHFEYREVICKT